MTEKTKKKAVELKDLVAEQFDNCQSTLEGLFEAEEDFANGLGNLPKSFTEPLVITSELNDGKTQAQIICDRRQTVLSYFNQGLDAETIAELLNVSFSTVLEDIKSAE